MPKTRRQDAAATLAVLTPSQVWASADARDADIARLRQSVASTPGVVLTGPDVLSVVLRQQVREDLPLALGLAALGVLIWHTLACRNLFDTVLSVLPSALGLLLAASVAFALNIEWNAITLAALPLILGTGVDGNLFIVLFIRKRAGEGEAGVFDEIHKGTIAMLMVGLTTLAGFGTLIFIGTPAVRDLGLLTSVGVLGAMITTLTLIMPALLLAERRRCASTTTR